MKALEQLIEQANDSCGSHRLDYLEKMVVLIANEYAGQAEDIGTCRHHIQQELVELVNVVK